MFVFSFPFLFCRPESTVGFVLVCATRAGIPYTWYLRVLDQPCLLRSFSQDLCCHYSGTLSLQTMSIRLIRGVVACRRTESRCVSRQAMLKHTLSTAWCRATRTKLLYHQLCRRQSLPPWCRHNLSTTFTETQLLVHKLATRDGKKLLSTRSTSGQPSVSIATGRHTKIHKKTRVVYGVDQS